MKRFRIRVINEESPNRDTMRGDVDAHNIADAINIAIGIAYAMLGDVSMNLGEYKATLRGDELIPSRGDAMEHIILPNEDQPCNIKIKEMP